MLAVVALRRCNSRNLVVKKLLSRAIFKKKHTEAPFINGNKEQLTPKRRGGEPSFGSLKLMHFFLKNPGVRDANAHLETRARCPPDVLPPPSPSLLGAVVDASTSVGPPS